MSTSGLPSPRNFFLTLAAEHIPTGPGERQEVEGGGGSTWHAE
ncbi:MULTISPECIES: hypothetical protein [unclassified Kitasatospora]